jgi:hypothetical protein
LLVVKAILGATSERLILDELALQKIAMLLDPTSNEQIQNLNLVVSMSHTSTHRRYLRQFYWHSGFEGLIVRWIKRIASEFQVRDLNYLVSSRRWSIAPCSWIPVSSLMNPSFPPGWRSRQVPVFLLNCIVIHGLNARLMSELERLELLLDQAMVLLDKYALAVEMRIFRHQFADLSGR